MPERDANWYLMLARRYAGNAVEATEKGMDLLYGKTVYGGHKPEHAYVMWEQAQDAMTGASNALDTYLELTKEDL